AVGAGRLGQPRPPASRRGARQLRSPVTSTPTPMHALDFVRGNGDLLRVAGRGEGRPLLLIMGLGGNIEMWDPLARALTRQHIQTIAYDAPGTGDSPARLVPQRMPGLARQAAAVLEAVGHADAAVLGVSFGGAIAQELALGHPRRVRRLVLASTMCGLGGIPGNPLTLSLLATPLRYYSPAFLRRTANILYGPIIGVENTLLREHINPCRARPPTLSAYLRHLPP